MPRSLGTPRVLLRRLREIMAEPVNAQVRLDQTVVQIAANMVAEVCSVYVRRRDGSMELFATEGLNPDAVHKTHLGRGEGLVGLIAERMQPLNLPEAQTHPAFSYRPETGEEIYHSFLGVPILRGGRTLGVLTVQNRTQRHYSEEEVEALQTTAMVLAELIASGELEPLARTPVEVAPRANAHHVGGLALSEGIALGHVVLHEPRVAVTQLIAQDINHERARLKAALEQLRATIDEMLGRGDVARTGEHRDILEAYRMFAHDRGWGNRLEEAISTGLTAEAAVERVKNETRVRMVRQTDPLMRERFHDLEDLANRLLRILAGRAATAAAETLPEDAVLVARTMGPAELMDYQPGRLRGLVLEDSGAASHVAIVARALGIATVGQAVGILETVDPGDAVVVDGEAGEVHVRPTVDVVNAYADKVRFRARRQERYAQLRDRPAVTADGQRIELNLNAGLLVDLPHLQESGADGIGLFRTELQFMISSTFPRLDEQAATYRAVLDAARGKPVVFRSLDVGGDKVLPYLRHAQEENPALGWRAIRLALDRPGLFRSQVRALMRAAAGRELRLMLPMVADVAEYRAARDLIERERAHCRRHGRPEPSRMLVGAMIEVPALLWQLQELLPMVDFCSVGSNDLLQFAFAADRTNRRVAGRFDPLSAPVLRMLRHIVDQGRRHGVPVTLCGEIAGRPLEAMVLVGVGFRSISMAPASVGPVKAMLLSLDAGAATRKVDEIIASGAGNARDALRAFAEVSGVEI